MSEQDLAAGKAQGFASFVQASDAFEKATCGDVIQQGQPIGNAFVETSPKTKLRDVLATMVHSDFSYQRYSLAADHFWYLDPCIYFHSLGCLWWAKTTSSLASFRNRKSSENVASVSVGLALPI